MTADLPPGPQGGWSDPGRTWRLSEFDIFRDLSEEEMEGIARSAPMRSVDAGTLLISPDRHGEMLFILKKGRVRLYRVAADGRSLTTAIIEAGQLFGEMVTLGQRLDDTYGEAIDRCVVCVMSRSDVYQLLLSDPRISAGSPRPSARASPSSSGAWATRSCCPSPPVSRRRSR